MAKNKHLPYEERRLRHFSRKPKANRRRLIKFAQQRYGIVHYATESSESLAKKIANAAYDYVSRSIEDDGYFNF